MKSNNTLKFMKKTDVIVIAAILLAGIGIWLAFRWLSDGQQGKAEIYYGSELVKTVDLGTGKDVSFTVPQDEHVVFHLYSDGSIAFESSDCPDKVCIRTGRLRHVGESAACLPNRMILKIVPINKRGADDMDMVA